MGRKRKIDNFVDEINETIQNLEFEELKNIKARIATESYVETIGDDEEEMEAVLNELSIELYDVTNNNLIHRSECYYSELELLENKEEIIKTILKLFDEDKSHMEICFITQTIPYNDIRLYNSIAKMVLNYDKYIQKMTLGIKSGLVFIDAIDNKMSKLKSIFSHQIPPKWMNNDYKYNCLFENDKCILNIYRNSKLFKTFTSQ